MNTTSSVQGSHCWRQCLQVAVPAAARCSAPQHRRTCHSKPGRPRRLATCQAAPEVLQQGLTSLAQEDGGLAGWAWAATILQWTLSSVVAYVAAGWPTRPRGWCRKDLLEVGGVRPRAAFPYSTGWLARAHLLVQPWTLQYCCCGGVVCYDLRTAMDACWAAPVWGAAQGKRWKMRGGRRGGFMWPTRGG
jgi:hypothetical protein